MGLFDKKNASAIDRRMRDLEKEIARLKTAANSTAKDPLPSAPLPPPPRAPAVPGRRADDLFAHAGVPVAPDRPPAETPAGSETEPRRLFAEGSSMAMRGREKFGRYFTAGGDFQTMRPLKRETRYVRNKAIVATVVAVIMLALLYWLYSR